MNNQFLTIALILSLLGNIVLIAQLERTTDTPALDGGVASDTPHDAEESMLPSGESYPFIRVVDGDTITVGMKNGIEYVRLIGIDAPEPNDPGGPQCYASEATAHLVRLLDTGTVVLHFDGTQGLRDRHGRLLAYVERPDGADVGAAMVHDGFAREFTFNLPYERQAIYQEAERQAQSAQRGFYRPGACE